jgi:hypothetical protein
MTGPHHPIALESSRRQCQDVAVAHVARTTLVSKGFGSLQTMAGRLDLQRIRWTVRVGTIL